MKRFDLSLASFAFMLYTMFVCSLASAEVINVTAGTQLFYDNFEGLKDNVSHAARVDNSGDYDPVAAVGTWVIDAEARQDLFQVTDHVGGDDPKPFQGKNDFRMYRVTSNNAAIHANFTNQTTTNDVLRCNWMVYVSDVGTDTTQTFFSMGLYDSTAANARVIVKGLGGGTVQYYGPSGWATIAGLTWTPQEWQLWEVEYTIKSNVNDINVKLTIGDQTITGKYARSAGSAALLFPGLPGYNFAPTFIDEVPEPSALALLAGGLVGLLAYAWRKRR